MKDKLFISIFRFVVVAILLATLLYPGIAAVRYVGWDLQKSACLRLQEYGYQTHLDNYSIFNDAFCFVEMEDGTFVYANDFNIADYKKPKVRNNER